MSMTDSPRVLLIYPKIPDGTYWSLSHSLPYIHKKSVMPPLGLVTIAAMLPGAWEVRLVDENVEPLAPADLEWADAVMLSAMVIQKERLGEIAAAAKKQGLPVIAGGPYPTQYYEEIAHVDHFVLNEAESGTLAAFLRDWREGVPKRAYARPVIRKNKDERAMDEEECGRMKAFFGGDADIEPATAFPAIDTSPMPRYELLDMSAYASMAVQFSRGCPFSCEFCSEPALFGHRPRVKSAARVVAELQQLYDLGFRHTPVFFVDDNFIGNTAKAMAVLEEIGVFQRERGYPFSLYTEASVDLARRPTLMAAMRDAGFDMVFVGLETTDAETLEAAHKRQNTGRDLCADVRAIQRYGMEVTAGFIVGMDREPDDICDQIYDFCQRAGIPTAMVGLQIPARGSLLRTRYAREGRLLDDDSRGSNTHDFSLQFVPDRGRDPDALVADYKRLLARLYPADGGAYFERCRVLLAHIGACQTFTRKVRPFELRVLIRSLLRQVFSSYGTAYCRLLVKTLVENTSAFPEAVRLAITGHHHLTITRYALMAAAVKQDLDTRMDRLRSFVTAVRQSGAEFNEHAQNYCREQYAALTGLKKRITKFPREYSDELYQRYRELLSRLQHLQTARLSPVPVTVSF